MVACHGVQDAESGRSVDFANDIPEIVVEFQGPDEVGGSRRSADIIIM